MARRQVSIGRSSGTTLTDQAYHTLRRAIIEGELEEGTFLSGPEIMKQYGIGRTPFREACNRLLHERLLNVVSRRGYFVPEISFRTVREWLEVRVLVEGLVAALAAQRATPEQIREFERIAEGSWESSDSNADYARRVKSNTAFHLYLAKMTRNRELERLTETILERTERLSYLELRRSSVGGPQIRMLHAPIVEAVRRRDPLAARQAVIADIRNGERDLFTQDFSDDDFVKWFAPKGGALSRTESVPETSGGRGVGPAKGNGTQAARAPASMTKTER